MQHASALNRVLRKAVAFLPMYACYYTGELAFQIVNRWPERWSEDKTIMDRIGTCIYMIYNTGMCWSVDLNDWAGFRLWRWVGDDAE